MNRQITDTLLMIRPVAFHKNEETSDNFYQQNLPGVTRDEIQSMAAAEFDGFVDKLRAKGIEVVVIDDTPTPPSPDSIYPNNWISFHEDGGILLYPMFANNRRKERREDILSELSNTFEVSQIDRGLIGWEKDGLFLEGTGSMILDRVNEIAYAAISERTNPKALADFCERRSYRPVTFTANQTVNGERLPIYHTNVMMCVGEAFGLICLDAIDDHSEREIVISSLDNSGKEVIPITEEQNNCFAGNMLQVMNKSGSRFIAMSEAAFKSLDSSQISRLEKHGEIIFSNIDTIETLGGGSARCMMAEVFLPRK